MSLYDQFKAEQKSSAPIPPSGTTPNDTPTQPAQGGGLYAQFKSEQAGIVQPPTTVAKKTEEPTGGITQAVGRKVVEPVAGLVESVGQAMRSFQWLGDRLVGDYVTQKDSQKRLEEDLATNKVQVDQIVALIRKNKSEGKDTTRLENTLKSMQINPADYAMTADTTKGIFYNAQDKTKEWSNILEKTVGLNDENRTFSEKVLKGLGSSLPYFVPGYGTMKLAGAMARVSPSVASLFGGSASASLESMAEAGQVYDEVKAKEGAQKAMEASNKTFLANAILLGLTERFGIFNSDVKGALKKALVSMPVEGFQEASQQLISNMNSGNDPWQGVLESGAIGSIVGGILGGGVGLVEGRPVQLTEGIGEGVPPAESPKEPAIDLQKRLEGGLPAETTKVQADITEPAPTPTVEPTAPTPKAEVPQAEDIVSKIQESKPLADLQEVAQTSDNFETFTKNISSNQENIIPQGIDVETFLRTNGFASLDEFYNTVKNTPELNNPLFSEARKYKTADEFVGAQPKLYHGSGDEIKEFKDMGKGGVWLTTDKKMAQTHANFIEWGTSGKKKAIVNEVVYQPKKVFKIKEGIDSFTGQDNNDLIEMPQQFPSKIAKIKSEGYDAIESSDGRQLFVFDPLQIKTSSQLTDIWEKANAKKAEKVTPEKIEVSKGAGKASIGRYRDDADVLVNSSALKPIQFPELIDIAKELMGDTPFIRKYTKANGMFYGRGGGEIGLNPDLFKRENLGQLQKTLAHEIGHLVDYLPDRIMSRGNLAGRLNTLRNFRKDFFAPMGVSRTDQELREQMWALSKYWRPVDEATAPASYLAYRKGSDEIYADFVSALFNDPRLTSEIAPTAYNVFFAKLDEKPQVKEAYFGLQDLLRYGDVIAKRRSATKQMFKVTEQEARERQIQNQVEQEQNEKSLWFHFKTQAVDITEAVREKVKEAQKRGIRINDDDNPNYYLEQRNYIGGKIKAEVDEKFNTIYQELQKNDLAWEDLGELMFYERVLKGDRQDIANPLGYQPDFVRELYDVYDDVGSIQPDKAQYEQGTGDMRSTLGEEKFNILKSLAERYRANLKDFFKQGREEGIYNAELEKMFTENAFYVPFKGAKYSGTTKTSFTVKQQKGTLGNIENPANTGIEKAVSIIRAIERNKVTRKTMEFLQGNFANEVQEAKLDQNGYPIDPREINLGLVTYMQDGKVKGYYVDKYIAEAIKKNTVSENNMLVDGLKYFNSGLFRPLFITFNLGFQSFNLIRDFKRFWKNIPDMTILKAMKLYAKSTRGAKIRAFGLPENPSPADIEAYNLITRLEKEQLLSITYNDVIKGEAIEDQQIDRILREVGVRETQKTKLGKLAERIGVDAKTPVIKELRGLMKFIEDTGNMIETLPKVAGVYALEGKMQPMEMRSYIRKYVGSPDFLAGGKFKPYMNEVFLFSNAIFHGIRADYEIATNPTTRSGYWMKTAQLEIVPKLLMMMAGAGLFGEALREMFANVSEYDKTNYTIVPLGIDQNGKTVYVRIPSDETGRLIGGLFWKTANAIKDPDKLTQMDTYTNLLAYAGGQVPSITPVYTAGMNVSQFLAGNNPYDFFRGRPVLTDEQQQAGGTERLKPFLAYMFEQLGGGVFVKLYNNDSVPRNPSLSEKAVSLPILSNIAGRFVKVSDYGQKEQIKNLANQIRTEQARESLQNRRIVFDYVDNTRGKSTGEANAMKHQMINEIFNGQPKTKEDRTKAQNLMKRFDTLRLRGNADARIDSLIVAQSNEEKVALLKEYKNTMSESDFADLKKFVIQKRVVSPQAFQMFNRTVEKK